MAKFNKSGVGTTGKSDTHFASTVHNDIQKSTFFRNQIIKSTFNAGRLIPIYIDEVIPGDTHEIDIAYISRLSTPVFPTMDEIELDFYFFFVPNRIVWDGWQRLHGENDKSAWTPTNEPALVPGLYNSGTDFAQVPVGSIADYYGLPLNFGVSAGETEGINILPFRGYAAIYNRWFRDQNLQAPFPFKTNDDPISLDLSLLDDVWKFPFCEPFKVCKKHDYFSSALPGLSKTFYTGMVPRVPYFLDINPNINWPTKITGSGSLVASVMTGHTEALMEDDAGRLNMLQILRNCAQLNKLLERDARGGTRYVEMLKAHFNVEAEDYRLQYPEFLGHHSTTMTTSQVPQTSSTDDVSPQGNLAAFCMSAGRGSGFKKSFVEHGYIHGFVVARQRKTYQQGVERFWWRRDRFDFYYPEFAHITEQPIKLREIYFDNGAKDENFGVQEAWADYRYKPNRVSGYMRSNAPNSLDAWHFADYYSNAPYLTDEWIKDNSEHNINRTLTVDSSQQHQFIIDIKVANRTTRPMPVYSIPGMLDHF